MAEADPPKLRPDMASFRLLVLDFVQRYIAQWGQGPSYGEIAAALGAERSRVFHAVRRLVKKGMLVQRAGPRGLAMPEAVDQAAAMLRAAGWAIDPAQKTATKHPLPGMAVLDYVPQDVSQDPADNRP